MSNPYANLEVWEVIETAVTSTATDPDDERHAVTIETRIRIHGNPGAKRINDEIIRHAERVQRVTRVKEPTND